LTLRIFVCCRECEYKEQGEPNIWYRENNGIICPNCGSQWATEETYQYRKKLDELWDEAVQVVYDEFYKVYVPGDISTIAPAYKHVTEL